VWVASGVISIGIAYQTKDGMQGRPFVTKGC
jgi:hypothetical protein